MNNSYDHKTLRKAIRAKTIGYLLAALGLVAGLAWNEAISAIIHELFPVGTNTVVAKLFYAIIVTVFVVMMSIYLGNTGEDIE